MSTFDRIVSVLFLTSSILLAAPPELKNKPAHDLHFDTEIGHFYQIEAQVDGHWKKFGAPIVGDGKPHQTYASAQDGKNFRVNELKNQWVSVWADEFEGENIDMSKWSHEENGYGGGNSERQFYSTKAKYSYVKDGFLNLAAFRDSHTTSDGQTQAYTSARLRTLYRGDWTFGRFEIRAKVPSGEGIWPAVWMLPTNSPYGGWAASGEIDILESRGTQVEKAIGTIHFGDSWPRNQHKGTEFTIPGKNAAEAFHVYAIEWNKDEIKWFIDEHNYQTLKKEEWNSTAAPDNASAPFDMPFHLLLNLAVGGGFFNGTEQNPDKLPDSAFPQIFQIDYVRVSQWAE